MSIHVNQNALSLVLALSGTGIGMMFPNQTLIGFLLLVSASLVLIFGIRIDGFHIKRTRSLNNIGGLIPILWIAFGFFVFIGGAIAIWHGVNLISPTKTELISNVQPIIIQPPSVGNLKQRANDLADDILVDLYIHGWPQRIKIGTQHQWKLSHIQQLPRDSDGIRKWGEDRSEHFKSTFYDEVLALRDEFAQFHIMDKSLNAFIKQYNEHQKDYVNVRNIEDIAKELKAMATQIK